MIKPVVLTGLRANNNLTLGNYFGGILPMISMAKKQSSDFQINMFVPDLHSFTTPIDHSALYEQIINTAKLFAAAGLPLDNENIHLYRQSHVPAHSELTWILDNFVGMGQLSRMTQFKDKSAGKEDVSVGLFNYPVLMAADILLYGATYVPVGDDQTQHLEFTRDIAERFNARFGDVFVVPQPVKKQNEFFGNDHGLRIMDLANPTKKMSKSDEHGKGVLYLSDAPEAAARKVMSATTDDLANVAFDRVNQPGISNLLELLALLRGVEISAVIQEFAGQQKYGDFKKVVANEVQQFLVNFQARLSAVDEAAVIKKLEASEAAMNQQANKRLYIVQQAVGLRAKVAL
jgi:tryptophanyl-tRNA synthetase